MRNLFLAAAVIGGFVWFMKTCAPSRAEDASFTGQWKRAESSEVSGSSTEELVNVKASRGKFRLDKSVKSLGTTGAPMEYDVVLVFDGTTMHELETFKPRPGEAPRSAEDSGPQTRSWKPSEAELREQRFWARSFAGNAGPGGAVAGRETKLYQVKERRPDAEVTVQAWVDAKTGIVLRSNVSLFAKQVDSLLNKTTEECLSVSFAPVPDSAFAKP
ncbi:MAG: hypothetical protein IPP68_11360 [Elusimicrobia bacterium]|nr:hypothetical protein [Elusimicrobiota bacterium]